MDAYLVYLQRLMYCRFRYEQYLEDIREAYLEDDDRDWVTVVEGGLCSGYYRGYTDAASHRQCRREVLKLEAVLRGSLRNADRRLAAALS